MSGSHSVGRAAVSPVLVDRQLVGSSVLQDILPLPRCLLVVLPTAICWLCFCHSARSVLCAMWVRAALRYGQGPAVNDRPADRGQAGATDRGQAGATVRGRAGPTNRGLP